MPPGAGILTPFGWRKMSDMKPGAAVCATDGSVQRIIAVYRRGVQPLYRLTWHDGTQTICDADHIWLGWRSNRSGKSNGERLSGEASARKYLTTDIVELYKSDAKTKSRFAIPVMSLPCTFTAPIEAAGVGKTLTRKNIHPYVLGALLGDGSVSGSYVGLTCADQEIIDRVETICGRKLSKYQPEGSAAAEYRFPVDPIRGHLEALGVQGHKADTKSIPRIYMLGSEEERFELLRGLMDTDGWAEEDGDCYYTSISKALAENVRDLARSLGAVVTWREKVPTFIYKGERKNGQLAYTLRIKMRQPERMFHLSRKKAACEGKEPQSMALWLEVIEPAGEGETICIRVSHPNSLFVTDGYVVTHNTDACLGEFAIHAVKHGRGARGVFMRREMPQADSLIDRSHDIYGPMGWTYHKMERQWTAPNGAILRFRPLEDDRDAEKYQGQFFSRIYLEELTNWPSPKAPDKMKATLRSALGVPVKFRATANPGGAGHSWVKQRYIDQAPQGRVPLVDESGRFQRMFIPARVTDNTALISNDPKYVERLKLSGSKELVRAWLEGDWAVVEGAFFDNWSSSRHVVRPFEVPQHWTRFRAMDWGSAAPFSVGWYAVSSDDHPLGDGRTLPRGGLLKYREWYGASSPNVGIKLTAEDVAVGISQREALDPKIDFGVLDPAAFAQDGGPSIAERMAYKPAAIFFRPADNKRIGRLGHLAGWDLVRHRLDGEAPDRPMLVFFDTCAASIRTIPLLQHDTMKVEDLDTASEDHAADELRYACASRPWIKPQPKAEKPMTTIANVTMNQLWKHKARQTGRL